MASRPPGLTARRTSFSKSSSFGTGISIGSPSFGCVSCVLGVGSGWCGESFGIYGKASAWQRRRLQVAEKSTPEGLPTSNSSANSSTRIGFEPHRLRITGFPNMAKLVGDIINGFGYAFP